MADVAATPRFSGFWRRLGGVIIDGIIVFVVVAVVSFILSAVGLKGTQIQVIIGVLIGLIYFLWGWGSGQTVGCMVLKMKIVDQQTGGAPGYGKALIRYVVDAICGAISILGIIGGLWLIWDAKKQTWWDKVAGTVVVDA